MHFIFILAHQSCLATCSDTAMLPVPYTDIPEKYVVTVNLVLLHFPLVIRHLYFTEGCIQCLLFTSKDTACFSLASITGPRTQHLPFTRRLQESTHALVPPWQNDWQAALVKHHQGGWGGRRACVCISYLSVTRSCLTPDENSLGLQFQHLLAYSSEGKDAANVHEAVLKKI